MNCQQRRFSPFSQEVYVLFHFAAYHFGIAKECGLCALKVLYMSIYITLSFSPMDPAFIFSCNFVLPAGNIYEAHGNLFGSWSFEMPCSFIFVKW